MLKKTTCVLEYSAPCRNKMVFCCKDLIPEEVRKSYLVELGTPPGRLTDAAGLPVVLVLLAALAAAALHVGTALALSVRGALEGHRA